MADFNFDFDPPSFSLGLDFDDNSEPQPVPHSEPLSQQAKIAPTPVNLRPIEEDNDINDDDFVSPVRVCDRPLALKRLRRGPASKAEKAGSEDARCNVDDDIEEFSSGEDCPTGNLPPNSVCGSSKVPLHGHKVVTSESGSQWKSRKGKDVPNASVSANVETKGSNVKFPQLNESPLRRFQLIDSDSDFDDPSVIEDTDRVPYINLTPKSKESESEQVTEKTYHQSKDLWKDFCSEKSFHIHTPAFDEVCKEYFTNVSNKSQTESVHHKDPNSETKSDGTYLPPAHCYFFHKDLRIWKLVRERLPYFLPLVAENNHEHKLQNASVIDYMGQFGNEETSRQTGRHAIGETSSSRKRKNVKKSQVDVSQDNSWINPKSSAGLPRNAANRRVQADTKSASAGHWFTDSSGRRVYVNKSGQELSGQIAYRHYRKESGMGFRNSKKKSAAKKKSGAKKAASKKR